jgi:transcriptional regulator with PAS, ATPase and Fis domain
MLDSPARPYVVGESAEMREVHTIIRKAAPWDANVCIEGENGTGRELVARAVHVSGPRGERPFVTLDCSTIAEGLIERHLFGHVNGAFTGARQGVFARSHTGTVFIDEITQLAPHLQAKLLRVIQTGELMPVGGSRSQRVNVRIITTTNCDLRQAVAEGVFREDLYFRIAVVQITIRRCASAAGTSRCWSPSSFASSWSRATIRTSGASRREPWRRSRATRGPGTCASSRTGSSGRSCSPTGT